MTIHVECSGTICHTIGEKHARRFSHCIRQDLYKHFQDTHVAPSKEYINRLLNITDEQFTAGNRDGVGATTSVLKKISSESRLVQQEHSDLITSLSILRKKLIENESKTQALNKKNTPPPPPPPFKDSYSASKLTHSQSSALMILVLDCTTKWLNTVQYFVMRLAQLYQCQA